MPAVKSNVEYLTFDGVGTWLSAHTSCASREASLPWLEGQNDTQAMISQMESKHIETAWLGVKKMNFSGLHWLDRTSISKHFSALFLSCTNNIANNQHCHHWARI